MQKKGCENQPQAMSFSLKAVPEMLPLASSLSPNADPGCSICVRAVLLGGCWDSRGAPAHRFYISSKQQL